MHSLLLGQKITCFLKLYQKPKLTRVLVSFLMNVSKLTGLHTAKWYPEELRMVTYEDYATSKVYRFLTNNMDMNLGMANYLAKRYLDHVLYNIDDSRLVYPE